MGVSLSHPCASLTVGTLHAEHDRALLPSTGSEGGFPRGIMELCWCLPDAVHSNSGLLDSKADSRDFANQGQHGHELEPYRRQALIS
jgi:hypothetical protein